MNLQKVISDIDSLPESTCIYVREPWARGSEAILVSYTENFDTPSEVKTQGFKYFLEVDILREILEPFLAVNPTSDQIFEFSLYYAMYDAFPDWSFELFE